MAVLNLILRADVRGSIEAIQKELDKLDHPEVQIKLLQATVGGITVADVTLADASDAVIVGFNVIPDEAARGLADERGVEIPPLRRHLQGDRRHQSDAGRQAETGRASQRLGTSTGAASVFHQSPGQHRRLPRPGRDNRTRLSHSSQSRRARTIGDYPLDSLRREKDDTKEVREGFECGIKLSGFNDSRKATFSKPTRSKRLHARSSVSPNSTRDDFHELTPSTQSR